MANDGTDPHFVDWEPIGRGAIGAVYKARDATSGSEVAIKILQVGQGDLQALGRFRQEAAAMGSVQHPGVVRINRIYELDGEIALVMELVNGVPLKDLTGSLQERHSVAVLGQLGEALDAIHSVGVVHRDLKPANILIDVTGRCRVADFGIAKFVGESIHAPGRNLVRTRTGIVVGTPTYLSPEIVANDPVDQRGDIYSLGVVAYELLVGRPPFLGGVYQLLKAHTSEAAPPPDSVVPDFPAAVASVLFAALAKAPSDRPSSAGEMVAGLIEASPPEWQGGGPADLAPLVQRASRSRFLGRTGGTNAPIGENAEAGTVAEASNPPPTRPALPKATSAHVSLPQAYHRWRPLALAAVVVLGAAIGAFVILALLH